MAIIPDTKAATIPTTSGAEADLDAGFAGDELADLEERRAGGDRGRHQEREAGRGLAVEPGEAGRPRSRSPSG